MILLDADVLLIDIRFPRDANFAVNQQLLERLRADRRATGIAAQALLEVVGTLQERCADCEVFVELLNLPPAPNQQRLLCRLESCWPIGFTPYSTARYQALNRDATPVAVAVEEVVV